MNTKFKIGDRVRYVGETDKYYGPKTGDEGRVVDHGSIDFCVDFDDFVNEGHDCYGDAKEGHGWYADECELELIKPVTEEAITTTTETKPLTIYTAPHGGYYVSQGDEVLYAALDTGDLGLFVEEFLDDN